MRGKEGGGGGRKREDITGIGGRGGELQLALTNEESSAV